MPLDENAAFERQKQSFERLMGLLRAEPRDMQAIHEASLANMAATEEWFEAMVEACPQLKAVSVFDNGLSHAADVYAVRAAYEARSEHDYLPQSDEEARRWHPHWWVIRAMVSFAKAVERHEVARLRQALRDIADPIAAWQRDLPVGHSLDGAAAVRMAADPEAYKRIARAALVDSQDRRTDPAALPPPFGQGGAGPDPMDHEFEAAAFSEWHRDHLWDDRLPLAVSAVKSDAAWRAWVARSKLRPGDICPDSAYLPIHGF